MYSTNSSRVEYYRHRREQDYYSYDEDFKGFRNEAEKADKEKNQNGFLSIVLGKLRHSQKD